jgi:hypothetical protein
MSAEQAENQIKALILFGFRLVCLQDIKQWKTAFYKFIAVYTAINNPQSGLFGSHYL